MYFSRSAAEILLSFQILLIFHYSSIFHVQLFYFLLKMYLISFKYSWGFLLCGDFEGGSFEARRSPTLIKKKGAENFFGEYTISSILFMLFIHHVPHGDHEYPKFNGTCISQRSLRMRLVLLRRPMRHYFRWWCFYRAIVLPVQPLSDTKFCCPGAGSPWLHLLFRHSMENSGVKRLMLKYWFHLSVCNTEWILMLFYLPIG